MTMKLILAIITITAALIYSILWAYFLRDAVEPCKKACDSFFWCGLLFDTTGTSIMSSMAKGAGLLSAMELPVHWPSFLMLFHALWASIVLGKKDERKQRSSISSAL